MLGSPTNLGSHVIAFIILGGIGQGMKRDVLCRYECDEDGRILIDVSAIKAEDLYNNFDRTAPYVRRDLDQDLVDYLSGCAKELGARAFAVRFTLVQPPEEQKLSRIRESVKGFFLYLAEIERQKVRQMFRRSAILFCIGLVVLFLSVAEKRSVGTNRTLVVTVFTEGLTVAAWVLLWEAITAFLIDWLPRRKEIILFRRLAQAPVVFRSSGPQVMDKAIQSDLSRIA